MTINNVLHTLWTNSITDGDKLSRGDEKRLWMTLQRFVEEKGGLSASAESFNPTGRSLSQIGRSKQDAGLISRACNRARTLLWFLS